MSCIMKIRPANPNDADAIVSQNMSLALESENITLNKECVSAGVHALLCDKSKGFYVIAEENNHIIGQLMITVEWSDWRNKPLWWVQSVYVQKEWRNKTVFTQLLDFIRKQALKENVAFLRLYVHKDNHTAIQVYEKNKWSQEPYLFYQTIIR